MSDGLTKTSRNPSARRAAVQRRVFIGDRDEPRCPSRVCRRRSRGGALRRPSSFGSIVEPDLLARMKSDVCRREPSRREPRRDRRNRARGTPGRTRREAEDLTQDFRGEARAAHAEQHDVREPVPANGLGERAQPRHLRRHDIERVEPAEAAGDQLLNRRIVGPDVELFTPQRARRSRADRDAHARGRSRRSAAPGRW